MICCSLCKDDQEPMIKIRGQWVCDPCQEWEAECDDLDLDEYEENKRQRLAEQAEY